MGSTPGSLRPAGPLTSSFVAPRPQPASQSGRYQMEATVHFLAKQWPRPEALPAALGLGLPRASPGRGSSTRKTERDHPTSGGQIGPMLAPGFSAPGTRREALTADSLEGHGSSPDKGKVASSIPDLYEGSS